MQLVYVSLSAMGPVALSSAVTQLVAHGVRQIELAIGPRFDNKALPLLLRCKSDGVDFRAHHAFEFTAKSKPFDLARRFDRDEITRRLDWLTQLGVNAYSVHAGSYEPHATEANYAYDRFVTNATWLGGQCDERKMRFGVETMFPLPRSEHRRYLLSCPNEVASFLRDCSGVLLVVDLAHLGLWSDTKDQQNVEVCKLAEGRILEVHLSDNDRRRDLHSAISPRSWWWPYRASLRDNVPVVLESRVHAFDGSNPQRVRSLPSLTEQLATVESWLHGTEVCPGIRLHPSSAGKNLPDTENLVSKFASR